MAAGLSDSRFAKLVGLTEAKRQLAQLPELVRRPVYAEVKARTDALASTAQAYAPRRAADALPGYSGGALESRLAARTSLKHLIGLVGIERGAVAVVKGRAIRVERTTRVQYRRLMADGSYKTAWRRRVLGKQARARVASLGGVVIQPTRYGHLAEFGHGGPRRASAHPYMRPAAKREQAVFGSGLRSVLTGDVVAALQQAGRRGGGA